jgi:hypothetical protein
MTAEKSMPGSVMQCLFPERNSGGNSRLLRIVFKFNAVSLV